MRRLNDTAALKREDPAGAIERTIKVREITNGYLVCETEYNSKTGRCVSEETYSKSCPTIIPARVKRGVVGDEKESLSDAVEYMHSPAGLVR